jgi:hypothetical protein
MKLANLFEVKEKNLIGLFIKARGLGGDVMSHPQNFDKITIETPQKHWYVAFNCDKLELTSLKGSPATTVSYFSCSENKLTSLEYATPVVNGDFYCDKNLLTSLKDIHKICKQIDGNFVAASNPIKSHVLGLLLIKNLNGVTFSTLSALSDTDEILEDVEDILNKYLPNKNGNKNVLACQNELLDRGFDEYAQL